MRYWGAHYDTGVHFSPKQLSRVRFDHDLIRFELRAIRDELNANAVRIIGEDIDRLAFAAREASELGLAVFLNPWLIDRGEDEIVSHAARAAAIAEELRVAGGDVIFLVGCELSLFAEGIIPGSDVYERVDWLVRLRDGEPPEPSIEIVGERLNSMLRSVAGTVRQHFRGPVTYAAGRWEAVDWDMFDSVGLDYYRQEQTDQQYAEGLREAATHGKPVGVLEIGCCTFEGADKLGGMGWMLLDEWHEGGPRWVDGEPPERSESTQALYLKNQLDIFVAEDVETVFVFTFSQPYVTHDPVDPARDFDRACFSLTKLYSEDSERGQQLPPWEPKEAFYTLAGYFAGFAAAAAANPEPD